MCQKICGMKPLKFFMEFKGGIQFVGLTSNRDGTIIQEKIIDLNRITLNLRPTMDQKLSAECFL